MYYCQPVELILSHLTSSTWYVLLSTRGSNPVTSHVNPVTSYVNPVTSHVNPVTSHVIHMVCITVSPWN